MQRKTKLLDIAEALGVSTGTVHRPLHNHPSGSPMTKVRVQQIAKTLGYRPNLAARCLSSKRNLIVSANTLQGTTSFWDEVRAGISEVARSAVMENVEIEYRTYPRRGEGEEEAVEGECPSFPVALAPHLVMRGNLDFFLERQSSESTAQRVGRLQGAASELVDYFG